MLSKSSIHDKQNGGIEFESITNSGASTLRRLLFQSGKADKSMGGVKKR